MKALPVAAAAFLTAALTLAPSVTNADPANCPTASGTLVGAGLPDDPYLIQSPADLQEFKDNPISNSSYLQTGNIDMGGCTWNDGGINVAFAGTYDGGGFTISGLQITGSDQAVGFIRQVNGGTIKNVGFTGSVSATTTSGTTNVGALVGTLFNGGTVEKSLATGNVQQTGDGTSNVGGLVGRSQNGTVKNSYFSGSVSSDNTVTATERTGGLVGLVEKNYTLTIENSYAFGSVTADNAGGLLGTGSGGGTANAPASFWNTDTVPASGAGTPKTTSELKDISTYSSWDISSSFSDAKTWTICSAANDGYPFLTAFYTSDPCSGGGDGPAATSPQPTYTFSFLTSGGGTCLPTVTVRRFERFTLPPAVVACTPLGTSMVGWSIPGQDWAFSPGRVVTVVDSQVFTAMAREPEVTIVYDANVNMTDPCIANDTNIENETDRHVTVQTPRTGTEATLATSAPCAPPEFELIGWTDANTPDGSGQAQTGAQTYEPGAAIPDSWNIDDPNPVNRVRLYALWGQSAG